MSLSIKGSDKLAVHSKKNDIVINKSDLQIYFTHFKNAVIHTQKENIFIAIANIAFVLSIFFTSDFKSVSSFLDSSKIKLCYILLAAILIFYKIQEVFKKDNSKYKETDPEKMTDIIESNCNKNK